MSEKRFEVIDNSFSMWIVDTTLKEDKHEGAIYTAYDMCRKLNELCEENEQLQKKNKVLEEDVNDYHNGLFDLHEKYDKLEKENEQLRQIMQKVCELLEEEVDLFSDEATEHDVIAYREMQGFDNKDAYYICTATKKVIQMLKGRDSDERERVYFN